MNHPNRDRARELRSNLTTAEKFVWSRVRREKLGGYKFRRQHPIGPFIVDFVCLQCRLVLELDGGQHAANVEYDLRRTKWLEGRGYRVFRMWNFEIPKEWDAAADEIWRLLKEREAEGREEPTE